MKRQIAILLAAASLLLAAGPQTFTGVITDDLCGKANHKDMNISPDAKCVAACVKGMGGKYVLYDGKETYILSDQRTPAKFPAKKVTVTGTLDEKTKTIQVTKIVPAS